jgi:hypothetical protein
MCDRPVTDVFEVQYDIANHIFEALRPHLGAGSKPLLSRDSGKISPEPFERFLLAPQSQGGAGVAAPRSAER